MMPVTILGPPGGSVVLASSGGGGCSDGLGVLVPHQQPTSGVGSVLSAGGCLIGGSGGRDGGCAGSIVGASLNHHDVKIN